MIGSLAVRLAILRRRGRLAIFCWQPSQPPNHIETLSRLNALAPFTNVLREIISWSVIMIASSETPAEQSRARVECLTTRRQGASKKSAFGLATDNRFAVASAPSKS